MIHHLTGRQTVERHKTCHSTENIHLADFLDLPISLLKAYKSIWCKTNTTNLKNYIKETNKTGDLIFSFFLAILGNAVTSQHGALLSDDNKALKTNR